MDLGLNTQKDFVPDVRGTGKWNAYYSDNDRRNKVFADQYSTYKEFKEYFLAKKGPRFGRASFQKSGHY